MKISPRKLIILGIFVAAVIVSKYLSAPSEAPMPDETPMHDAMTVTNDQEFLEMMVPHHQEAIDTAKQVLARGQSPELKTLAENIIAAQTAEISQMQTWHQNWFASPLAPDKNYMPMMRPLEALNGAELDKQFIEDMIKHHEGAIQMAEQLQTFTEKPELKDLAKNIIIAQTTEIQEMKSLLGQ
ncbi:DUF305 domain-containing protein [Candidatus Gracilibacteria bacterium]|nr:DUF305 domain-containing protein [Candidatus Gracilibacteria bacterium]